MLNRISQIFIESTYHSTLEESRLFSALQVLLLFTIQAGIIYAVSDQQYNLAFWIILLPVIVWFGMNDMRIAIAIMFLFTLLDVYSREKFYEIGVIHTIPILKGTYPGHPIFFLVLFGCLIAKFFFYDKQRLYIGKVGWLIILFILAWAFKFILSTGSPIGFMQMKFIKIAFAYTLFFVYVIEINSTEKLKFIIKWMGVGGLIMLCYGYYQLIPLDVYKASICLNYLVLALIQEVAD